jgi:PAS domain S-box-containing protein
MEPILQAIFESAVDGIIVIDARGFIQAFNPAAERLFGYAAHEVLGQNVNVLMPSPDREQHDRYLAGYLETGIPRIIGTGREVMGRRRNGSRAARPTATTRGGNAAWLTSIFRPAEGRTSRSTSWGRMLRRGRDGGNAGCDAAHSVTPGGGRLAQFG